MTIAEMKAEAEEVQEEVKRRRGRKAGQLPLVLMLLCISGQVVEILEILRRLVSTRAI